MAIDDRRMDRQRQLELFSLEAHRLGVERLRANPSKLQILIDTLHRWRRQSGPGHSDPYFDAWERLLLEGVDAVEAATCHDNDHAAVMRSTSPFAPLITASERMEMLTRCRNP